MGNYNPRAPVILGQEFVPIRDVDFVFSPSVNAVEVGVTYLQTAVQRIRDARFYVHELVAPPTFYQVGLVGLYPTGGEDNTGPIQQCIIPVSAATVSGGNISLTNAADYPSAFYQPGDSKYARLIYNSGTIQLIDLFFGVNAFPQLNGKRILNVSLLYAGTVTDRDANGVPINFVNPNAAIQFMSLVSQYNTSNVGQTFSPKTFISNTGTLDLVSTVDAISTSGFPLQQVRALDLGDVNNCWDPTNLATAIKMPWRFQDLVRFESGATNGQKIQVQFVIPLTNNNAGGNDTVVTLEYFALRVLYCEETRIAYGGQQFQYAYGMNSIALRDTSFNADPVIPIGSYLPTLSWVSMGQVGFGQGITGEFPKLNALRQLSEIPSHVGKQINVPFPLEDRVGVPFTSQLVDVLPQVSLHVSGGTMTEPHVYGRQAVAQVYGSITATQEILDSAAGGATTWPQVRYYARRYGDTAVPLLLDSPTITGAGRSVSLTPAEWDALPELIDGWKEITKRFTSPPTMGAGTNPQWRWSATGETLGNRWEILGAIAPAISGVPGSTVTQVPTAHRLATATYGAPAAGSTINMGWVPGYTPPVTATTDDVLSDAVLMFSQDPATITGFTVTPTTMAVTGFTECTRGPCCIPTAIQYNRVTWGLPVNTGVGTDAFNRVTSNGLGTADSGGTYTTTGAASQYATDGAKAIITPSASGTDVIATLLVGSDFDITVDLGVVANVVAGSTARVGVVGRYTDSSNFYYPELDVVAGGGTTLFLSKKVAGVFTDIGPSAGIAVPFSANAGASITMRFTAMASRLRVKVWPTGTTEPDNWNFDATDTSLTTGPRAGLYAGNLSVNGNAMFYDNLFITPPSYWFKYYELQRMDPITDWQTIMLATSPAITGFSDYEARVGLTSSYRIRGWNALNFAGAWSVTGTGAIAEPGVTMPSCGTNKRGVLIFTTNEIQDGSSNLAYVMTWEDAVSEDFSFPESDTISVQRHHDRDFQVAFHGTERGGEQFQRRLLLANAAVALPRLANMDSLRDLAWEDLAYVCVRDDIGDRWLATVIVPGGSVRRKRRLYNADITVIEVTDTPSEVDP